MCCEVIILSVCVCPFSDFEPNDFCRTQYDHCAIGGQLYLLVLMPHLEGECIVVVLSDSFTLCEGQELLL